jgi:hypothetical protein
VTVLEPGLVEDSCSACLTVGTPPPPPAPTSITPGSFAAGGAKTPATIAGSNFAAGATVTTFAGIKITGVSFVSSSDIAANVTVESSVPPGTYNLWVNNPDGVTGECTGCITVT